MSAVRKQWLIKVIAGPHQGAEVGLRSGKMLIGSDDECDVVLHDVLIAPQHVEIEVTASGVIASPLGGRVYVNGKRIRESRQAVPDFGFISVGGTHLVIGPDGGKWPLLSAADVPELEKEAPVAEEAPAEPEANQAPSPTVVVTAPSSPVSSPTLPAKSKGSAFFGIFVGLVLLVGWLVVYSDLAKTPAGEQPAASAKPADRAKELVSKLGLQDTIKIEETAGRVSISGYVDTEARQRELQAAFREALPGLHTRIFSLEKIASSARTLLEDQHLPLTVSSLSDGKLKITGTLTSADPWVRMRQVLMQSVPGLGGIDDGVEIIAEQRFVAPRQIVAAPKPSPVVVPAAPAPKPVAVAAPAPPAPAPAAPPAEDEEYSVTASTIDTPDATIAMIKLDPEGFSFLRLSSGGVYFLGARLPYGGKVTKIEATQVTIQEKGKERSVLLGDAVMQPKEPKKTEPQPSATAGSTASSSK